ncbi:hypothetical protein SCLCIDRAFT_1103368 [Scleroderma citrinum Foug A]|uniref:Uncharacterized protein n=1 Tax=Scleroderma citrinum Foug A TaxID=1036808 RepID=A0A0C2Z7S7_9AGAM|nr:hypothetical protein SCLCIDRAFT_1103368 [Scleroderma citrinum Foug A]
MTGGKSDHCGGCQVLKVCNHPSLHFGSLYVLLIAHYQSHRVYHSPVLVLHSAQDAL